MFFDEGKSLVNRLTGVLDGQSGKLICLFRLIRRALLSLNEKFRSQNGIVIAGFADTFATIADFAAPLKMDSSLRQIPLSIMPPFIWISPRICFIILVLLKTKCING